MENIEEFEPKPLFGMSKKKPVEIEESLETVERYLDGLVTIPGINWSFGLYSIVGLIPGIGDSATAVVSFYILAASVRYGVPKITLLRMGLNIAIGYVIGVIPILGDAFDFVWKPNNKNMKLLRERATVSAEDAKKGKTSDWLFVFLVILTLIGILVGTVMLSLLVFGTVLKGFWDLFRV
jgi:hypothetical protein